MQGLRIISVEHLSIDEIMFNELIEGFKRIEARLKKSISKNGRDDGEGFILLTFIEQPAEDDVGRMGIRIGIDEEGVMLRKPIGDEVEGANVIGLFVLDIEMLTEVEKNIGIDDVIFENETIEEEVGGGASGEQVTMLEEGARAVVGDDLLEVKEGLTNVVLNVRLGNEIDPIEPDKSEIIFSEMMKARGAGLIIGREDIVGVNLEYAALDAHIGIESGDGIFTCNNSDGAEMANGTEIDVDGSATFRGAAFDEMSEDVKRSLRIFIAISSLNFIDADREIAKREAPSLDSRAA